MHIEKSSIYTKGGDKGKTSLLGGKRVSKFHQRIEAYGTVDELMAQVAMLRDMIENPQLREQLSEIMERLMASSAVIAADGGDIPENMPELENKDVLYVEEAIDRIDHELPKLDHFILPGGHIHASQANIARTVCRRAERILLKLHEEEPVDEIIIRYFNRLSDYFFLISRKIAHDYGIKEIPWKP